MTAQRNSSRRPADPVLAMLKAMEIRVVPTFQQRGAGETHAVQVIRRLFKQHGQDHAVLTLRSIAETGQNSAHLTSFVIWGVSDVVRAHPEWVATGETWLQAMDQIDLGAIIHRARGNRKAVPLRAAVSTSLFTQLLPIFFAHEMARQEQEKRQRQQGRQAKPPSGQARPMAVAGP